MATPREIRRRIRSVQNTSQITRAMQTVSAAKMRRAQDNVLASRAYADRIRLMIAGLYDMLDADSGAFPLLARRPVERIGVVVITADKGLAGALNSNVIRRTLSFLEANRSHETQLVTVGRRGRDFFRRTNVRRAAEFIEIGDNVSIEAIRPIIDIAITDYVEGNVDAVELIYTEFINTLVQRPVARQLLPIEPPSDEGAEEAIRDFIFEPDQATLLEALLPRYVEVQFYQAMLEALASEHSARMVAMRNATDNANDLLTDLRLTYNKARQTQITREVSEIAAGAVALTG